MLAPEFVIAEPTIAQPAPDQFLSPGALLAQGTSAFDAGHGETLSGYADAGKESDAGKARPAGRIQSQKELALTGPLRPSRTGHRRNDSV